MSTAPRHARTAPPGRGGSLFRTELARLRTRRLIQVLVVLAVLSFTVIAVVATTQHSPCDKYGGRL